MNQQGETTETRSALTSKTEGSTTAGGYFVSNYPPFNYWSADAASTAVEALGAPPQPDKPLGVYVHIPFCRKRCHFCYFKVYTDKNAGAIRRYLDAVLVEAERVIERAFVGGRKPTFVYFGGGTPSYLSVEQLGYLFDGLKALLPWDAAQEVAFECEPGTLNEKKLAYLRGAGVTRLSLGVENFTDEVLKANNRAHDAGAIERAYNFAREVGFPHINIDLIAGMLEETEANWQYNIERTLELKPDAVTVYQMEIPFNTTIYQQMRERGELTAPVADWPTKRRWAAEAFARLEGAGYTVTSAYTAVTDPRRVRFVYRDELWRGCDMLALGVSSFGHASGVHYQNEKDFEPYIERVEAGEVPVRRAFVTSEDQRLIRELVLLMKLGRVERSYFVNKFGVDVVERFAEVFDKHARAGDLSIDGDAITLTREALLRVDTLLIDFFEPGHRPG